MINILGDMNICRFHAGVASIGSNLYICGGSDDASRLNTVERYDSFNNVWLPLAPMSSNRNGVGVTVCSGMIYAIGKFNFYFWCCTPGAGYRQARP